MEWVSGKPNGHTDVDALALHPLIFFIFSSRCLSINLQLGTSLELKNIGEIKELILGEETLLVVESSASLSQKCLTGLRSRALCRPVKEKLYIYEPGFAHRAFSC